MKVLIQRVLKASVSVEGRIVGSINRGFLVLLGCRKGDSEAEARLLAHKTVNLRIFEDNNGKMNLNLDDVNGSVLVVSQFTLYADTTKGNRPSFIDAADPVLAENLYNVYIDALRRSLGNERVQTGIFRASMQVELINDGPVTIEITAENNKQN